MKGEVVSCRTFQPVFWHSMGNHGFPPCYRANAVLVFSIYAILHCVQQKTEVNLASFSIVYVGFPHFLCCHELQYSWKYHRNKNHKC